MIFLNYLWTVDCGLWAVDCGLWTVDCGIFAPVAGLAGDRSCDGVHAVAPVAYGKSAASCASATLRLLLSLYIAFLCIKSGFSRTNLVRIFLRLAVAHERDAADFPIATDATAGRRRYYGLLQGAQLAHGTMAYTIARVKLGAI